MKFDGYAGNIAAEGLSVRDVSFLLAGDLGARVVPGRAVRRYGEVLRVESGGHCAVWVGRDSGNDLIYFEGKGDTSPDLVAAVRSRFGAMHTVSRADVAEDFDQEGGFEVVQSLVRASKGPRVHGGFVALPDDPEEGRTWAAGKRGGNAYLRLYEAGKMRERLAFGRPNWFRLELEGRPHYAADKRAAASMSPVEFWGLSSWTRQVGQAVLSVDIPRYEVPTRTYDFDKTTLYLARTFRRHFQQMKADHGDWECLGREFEAIWSADDQAGA
jgi:hypothetical protein